MAGATQRDRAQRDAGGGPSGGRGSLRGRSICHHPGVSAVARDRVAYDRPARSRRDRARRPGVRARAELWSDRRWSSIRGGSSRSHHHAGGPPPIAGDLPLQFLRHGWWPDLLRAQYKRTLPARGRLRRSHSQRREARRLTGAGSHKIRACDQSQDRKGAWARNSVLGAGPRRRGDRMKRRDFITLLGGAAAAWPLAARAQQTAKLPTIGLVGGAIPSTQGTWIAAFVQRMRELGWIENRAVAIEVRWAEGRNERYSEIAAELVQRKVDVIVTSGTAVVVAAMQATSVIPIVFAAAG